jgi:hypothetical protein
MKAKLAMNALRLARVVAKKQPASLKETRLQKFRSASNATNSHLVQEEFSRWFPACGEFLSFFTFPAR